MPLSDRFTWQRVEFFVYYNNLVTLVYNMTIVIKNLPCNSWSFKGFGI